MVIMLNHFSANFSLQSTSLVTTNLSKEIEAVEESSSSSLVKKSYVSSVETAEVNPYPKCLTDMPPPSISLSINVDLKSSEKTTTIFSVAHAHKIISSEETTASSTVDHAMLNTESLPDEITASPTTQSQQIVLFTDLDSYSNEILNILAGRDISEDLHKATWINILDSGGQPQFADVSRAFIRGNTFNIICTNLAEDFSDKPQFYYSIDGKLLNQPSELQMKNIQVIEHYVCLVAASKSIAIVDGNQSLFLQPLFMIIETYFDMYKTSFLHFLSLCAKRMPKYLLQ